MPRPPFRPKLNPDERCGGLIEAQIYNRIYPNRRKIEGPSAVESAVGFRQIKTTAKTTSVPPRKPSRAFHAHVLWLRCVGIRLLAKASGGDYAPENGGGSSGVLVGKIPWQVSILCKHIARKRLGHLRDIPVAVPARYIRLFIGFAWSPAPRVGASDDNSPPVRQRRKFRMGRKRASPPAPFHPSKQHSLPLLQPRCNDDTQNVSEDLKRPSVSSGKSPPGLSKTDPSPGGPATRLAFSL